MAKISHMSSYSDVSFFTNKMATKGNIIRRDHIKDSHISFKEREIKLLFLFLETFNRT